MKTLSATVGAIIVLGLMTGCAGQKARKAAAVTPPQPTVVGETTESEGRVERREVTTVTATVVSIDQKKREVTLRGSEGNVETVQVGDEVRNLPQVRKGDRVVVKYYESLAFELQKKGTAKPGITTATTSDRAPVGGQPGAAVGETMTITATVTKVDRAKSTISLKGPKGRTAVVHVKEPRRLENVKKGDLIDITYTEALAIAVEPAS